MSVAIPNSSHPPLELPDLTLPRDTPRTAKRVLGLYLQRTWQRWQSLPLGALAVHNRGLYQQTLALLKAASQTAPNLPLQLLRWPTLSTLITCIHDQLVPGGDLTRANQWVREACALWLLELAHARLLPAGGVTVPRDPMGQLPVLRSVAANLCVTAGPEVTAWHFGAGQLEVQQAAARTTIALSDQDFDLATVQGVTASRPYFEIVPGIVLATSDNNPLSDFEAHPDKHGNQLDLGGHPAQEWCEVLRQCLQLIDEHLPLLGQELRLILRVVVPVGWDPERHLSASYQEAIGLIYLTLHPNLMTMTEAVVHEYQHNKINAAFAMDPLLHNAWSPLYASPVRPDPRPLHGVVLAVHAFQPVAKLYEAMDAAPHPMARNPSWQERFRKIIGLNREGSHTVLSHAEATETGCGLFAEMRALDDHFAAFEAQHWPG
jgi:HEXXH motif-containing protein